MKKDKQICPFCNEDYGSDLGYHLSDTFATGFSDTHTLDTYIDYIILKSNPPRNKKRKLLQ